MKILILANNSGGLYDFRHELIFALLNRGDVVAVTPFDDKVEELKGTGCQLVEVSLDRRGINPLRDLRLLRQYQVLIKRENPDLVITYTIKPNIYGGIVCRLRHIPYAANITGLGTAFQERGLLRALVTELYRFGLKRAKAVFFENAGNRELFLNEHIIRAEQACLLNGAGVNLERYQVAEYPEEEAPTRFLFMGRIMREKGVDELFAAMRKLRAESVDCTLNVLGGYEEDYRAVIEQCEREGWLRYYGYQKDVRPFIAASHCFVLPSWHEGMANTNLECAAMGRPVITSRIHGCMEAVEDGVSGFLCERQNAEDLARVMGRFAALPYATRREMGLAGRQRMERLFDKRQIVSRTLERLK